MIHKWATHAVAILADGKVMKGQPKDTDMVWSETGIDMNDVVLMATCPYGSMLAVLLNDGRLLAGRDPTTAFINITTNVEVFIRDTLSIRSMHIMNRILVVQTDCNVCIMMVYRATSCPRNESLLRHNRLNAVRWRADTAFPSEIDLVTFGDSHGYVRTIDNKLYLITNQIPTNRNPSYDGRIRPYGECRRPIEVEFAEAGDIAEIICYGSRAYFIMGDGRVFESSMRAFNNTHDQITQIIFPEGEAVRKITSLTHYMFYLTKEGNCYFSLNGWPCDKRAYPVQLQHLSRAFAEDVIALNNKPADIIENDVSSAIIKYDGGRLCYICNDLVEKVIQLSFFDDKDVVSVIDLPSSICFITREGCVYHMYDIESEPVIDPFFDTNPLATKTNTQRIKSACSNLDAE